MVISSARTSSGVVGAGRYPLPEQSGPTGAQLRLGGRPVPIAAAMRIYTCGITPYDVTHLGHAATFVWADLLASVARATDVETISCRNVTDVDDVLTEAAGRQQRHYDEFAATQEFRFDRDMRDLGVARPELNPHARGHVTGVIQLAQALLAVGRAYEHDGVVHFRAPADLDLGGLTEEQALAALAEFGDDADDGRQSPFDVPLWRPSPEQHPAWPSPWGWGRPAWHVECAAMAMSAFGSGVDALVGGADLRFPHHAYQAAIVEAATGSTPFARSRVHVGTVHHGGAKMAKSTGNLVLVRDLLAEHSGPALRLMLLHRHWSEPWEYEDAQPAAAAELLDRLHAAAGRAGARTAGDSAVLAALLDDLDVPRAVEVALEAGGAEARTLIDVLGLSGATV